MDLFLLRDLIVHRGADWGRRRRFITETVWYMLRRDTSVRHVALSLKNPALYYSRPQVQIKSNGSDAFAMLILEPMLSTIKLHAKNGWALLGDMVEGQPLQLVLDLVPKEVQVAEKVREAVNDGSHSRKRLRGPKATCMKV